MNDFSEKKRLVQPFLFLFMLFYHISKEIATYFFGVYVNKRKINEKNGIDPVMK